MAKNTMLGKVGRLGALAVMGASMLLSRGAAAHGAAALAAERFITAQGTGEVRVRPDSARVSLGVSAEAKTLDQARQMVNEKMAKVIRDINALDIPSLTMQTQVLQVYPIRGKQAEGSSALPPIVGYHASNGVSVDVSRRSADVLGNDVSRIVDAGLKAGATDVDGVQLYREDLAAPREAALAQAVTMAERDARSIAGAARVTLGAPISLEAANDRFAQTRVLEAASLKLSTATPVEIGEITVSAQVTAKYKIR